MEYKSLSQIGLVPTSAFTNDSPARSFYRLGLPHLGQGSEELIGKELFVPAFWPGGWERNYFHWTLDILPSVLATIEWGVALGREVHILKAPDDRYGTPPFVAEWLRILSEKAGNVSVIEAWHEDDIPQVLQLVAGRIRWCRSARTGKYHLTNKIEREVVDLVRKFCPVPLESYGRSRRILISRRNAPNRRTSTTLRLERQIERRGFEPVSLESLSIAQQVNLFRSASHIAGVHGAGFTNLIWTRRAKVFEFVTIRHSVVFRRTEFRQLSHTRGNTHRWLHASQIRTHMRLDYTLR